MMFKKITLFTILFVLLFSLTAMAQPDSDMTVRGSIAFPTVYSTGSTIDDNAASGQKVVPVAATTNFSAADRVIIGRGTDREEEFVIDSVSAGVSITSLTNLTYNHVVDADTTVDAESAADQKILAVTATDGFVAGEEVLVDEGETHEATYTIDTIQSGVSLTMTENLEFTHDAAETVVQTGTDDVLEVCMASLSNVIDKSHYKDIVIFLPSTWETADITFVACDTPDGTFNQVVFGDDVGEVTVASVAASKVIALNGELRDALTGLPYIKLRSGTAAAAVDQGTGSPEVNYVLTR
jgi:hypothetical protein